MFSSVKMTLALLVFGLTMGVCQTANAQTTYTIGPLTALGSGVTPVEAESEANAQMVGMLLSIEASLVPGESIDDVYILTQGLVSSTTYEIVFEVTIAVENPFGNTGGPGGSKGPR